VVGVDADPVLLALAGADAPPGLALVDADLRDPAWPDRLPAGPYDAIVSTTALHWLTEPELGNLYRACWNLLRPGGVLADGDHLRSAGTPQLLELALDLDERRAARKRTEAEDWGTWWTAVQAAPEFSSAVAERNRRTIEHPENSETSREVHERALRAAGFAEVGVLWQKGTDAVLAAIR